MRHRLAYWIFLGALGGATFFMLRPAVDFNAGAPINQSRATVEGKTIELAGELGFSLDSLQMVTTRSQHLRYYKTLKDSVGGALPTVSELNRRNLFLNGWLTTIGSTLSDQEATATFNQPGLFDKVGRLQIGYDNTGRIRRVMTNPDTNNPTFVPGDSLLGVARGIAGNIFDYDLSYYALRSVDITDTLIAAAEPGFNNRTLDFTDTSVGNHTTFLWKKSDPYYPGPENLKLEIQPKIRELDSQYGTQIRYGASVVSFSATDRYEPEMITEPADLSGEMYIVFFISLALLVGLVFFKGVKHINKGQVEWKRALFIFVTVTLAIFGWRVLFLINTYDPFISGGVLTVLIFNFLLFGVGTGMYAALAYIGWEATAREDEEEQLHLMDAFWRYRFFFRETGDGLLKGFALGGVLLGLFALLLYLFDLVFFQFDSQFGFMEPSMTPKLLTINMTGWVNAWLIALGHIGITVGFLRKRIGSPTLFYAVCSLLIGFLLMGTGSLFALNGSMWHDLAVFTVMSPALVYVFNRSGLLTVSVGWWVFMLTILTLPYFGSGSIDVSYIAWVQAFVIGIPFLYGVAAYRYGSPISELGGYIPEYQERMANHLRVEKEIEIARESQFKLMPLQPPAIRGADVYGFFLPSFEVGGDYFDYVVSRNGTPDSETLNMTIVDVSGKAMKAAMHAVFTSGLLLSRLYKDDPASILREVAPTLYHRTDPQTFITCIIGQYRTASRQLTIANAGHCLPVLKRHGKAEFIATPDPRYPLGLRDRVDYVSIDKQLQDGDFLLLYSDGLPEAVDPEGQRFGYENLLELVETLQTGDKSSNEIALDIKRRIQKFSDYQLADDTTIICLKV